MQADKLQRKACRCDDVTCCNHCICQPNDKLISRPLLLTLAAVCITCVDQQTKTHACDCYSGSCVNNALALVLTRVMLIAQVKDKCFAFAVTHTSTSRRWNTS